MRQKDKLYHFIKYPSVFGIRKNSRVYKYICDLVCDGIATTGYSDKNTKHIETGDVMRILKRLGGCVWLYECSPPRRCVW